MYNTICRDNRNFSFDSTQHKGLIGNEIGIGMEKLSDMTCPNIKWNYSMFPVVNNSMGTSNQKDQKYT